MITFLLGALCVWNVLLTLLVIIALICALDGDDHDRNCDAKQ